MEEGTNKAMPPIHQFSRAFPKLFVRALSQVMDPGPIVLGGVQKWNKKVAPASESLQSLYGWR